MPRSTAGGSADRGASAPRRELHSDAYIPYRIAFDVEKLTWELEFFVKYFVIGYRGVALTAAERAALQQEWIAIVEELRRNSRAVAIATITVAI